MAWLKDLYDIITGPPDNSQDILGAYQQGLADGYNVGAEAGFEAGQQLAEPEDDTIIIVFQEDA